MRLELPQGRLADAVESNRKFLLLFHRGEDVVASMFTRPRFNFRDAALLLGALDQYGFHDEASEVLRSFPWRQRSDGSFVGGLDEVNGTGWALHAVAQHWRLTRDRTFLSAVMPTIALGARRLRRREGAGRRPGPDHEVALSGLTALAGLLDAAELLEAASDHNGARRCHQSAAALRADLAGLRLPPSSPTSAGDAMSALAACAPLGVLAPNDRAILAAVRFGQDQLCRGAAVYDAAHAGLSPLLTLQLAAVELALGDRRVLDRLTWMVETATDTFTWPEAIRSDLGGGSAGEGHDGRAAAGFLNLVRNMLVREADLDRSGGNGNPIIGIELCSMLPAGWAGQPLAVHDAPTASGRVSFALRWHGQRPALLWDVVPHDGVGPVVVSAPGLDATWSSTERRGETLLAGDVRLAGAGQAGQPARGDS